MFSPESVCSQGHRVSQVPGPFWGEHGISGTRSLLESRISGDRVSRGRVLGGVRYPGDRVFGGNISEVG